MPKGSLISVLGLCVVVVLACGSASASYNFINLTSTGASGSSGDGWFLQMGGGSGTGVFQPFYRLQANVTEKGYNYSYADGFRTEFDNKEGSWNSLLNLGSIPVMEINGIDYAEFVLDINENSGNGNQYLSLDRLEVWVSDKLLGIDTTAPIESYPYRTWVDCAKCVYRMEEGDWIGLDYSLQTGSGTADLGFYLPAQLLLNAGAQFSGTKYVYLYSEFGGKGVVTENGNTFQWDSCDGFEEWALREGPPRTVTDLMPEPSMGVLLLLAMLPAGAVWRRRRRGL
jgi:hypothetical protein